MFFNKNKALVKQYLVFESKGYQIMVQQCPGVAPLTASVSVATYVPTIGTVTIPLLRKHDTEKGIEHKRVYRDVVDPLVEFCDKLIQSKFSDAGIALIADIVSSGKTTEQAIALVNRQIQKTCAQSGIILQPCGGYDPASLAQVLGADRQQKVVEALGLSSAQPAERPKDPPPRPIGKKLH